MKNYVRKIEESFSRLFNVGKMKIGEDQRITTNKCLNCDSNLDSCTVVGQEGAPRPSDGDITMCIYCGHIMAFDDDANFREMTSEEAYAIAGDERILAISNALAEARKHAPKI